MIICPRCGSNNDEFRASCFKCFAPLHGDAATRIKPVNLVGKGALSEAIDMPLADSGDSTPAPEPPKKKGLFGRKK
jgi:hypothetical protein